MEFPQGRGVNGLPRPFSTKGKGRWSLPKGEGKRGETLSPFVLSPFSFVVFPLPYPLWGRKLGCGKSPEEPRLFSSSFPYALLALASCLVFSLAFRVAFPSPHCGRELG